MNGPANEAIFSFYGPVQIDIGTISATTTTPKAEIRIAAHEGTILSMQMGKASKQMALVINKVDRS